MKTINQRYQESYVEEVLDNGLKVVLWEKKDYAKSFFMMATPLGSFDLLQKSENQSYEYPAGVAHFLEHKMFEGEDGEDLSEAFSNYGANVNAYTSFNETTYYFHTTQDIYKPLELLLDLVQSLNISEDSVEKEKSIITQELHMYLKMSDSQLLYELLKSLYHKHPLRYEILGDDESIQKISYEDLKTCYELNYHPSKMILIGIVHDDVYKVLDFIKQNQANKQFKKIEQVQRVILEEDETVAREYFECEMDVNTQKVACSYKLKGCQDQKTRLKQEWAIKFLIDAYFTSLNSEYQNWLDAEIFKDYLGGEIDYGTHHGFLSFYGECDDQQRFVNLIDEQMHLACIKGIDESMLQQLKRRYFAEGVRSFQHFEEIAQLTYRAYFEGYDYFMSLDLFDEITCDYILEVCKQLDLSNKTITVVKGKSDSNI